MVKGLIKGTYYAKLSLQLHYVMSYACSLELEGKLCHTQ